MHYNLAARVKSGRGSARLERTVRVREVPGSNPGAPTIQQPQREILRLFFFDLPGEQGHASDEWGRGLIRKPVDRKPAPM